MLGGQELLGSWSLGVIVQRPHSHRTRSSRVWCLWTTSPATSSSAEQEELRPLSSALALSCNWALGPRGPAGSPFSVTTVAARASHSTVTVVHSETSGGLSVRGRAGTPGGRAHTQWAPPLALTPPQRYPDPPSEGSLGFLLTVEDHALSRLPDLVSQTH